MLHETARMCTERNSDSMSGKSGEIQFQKPYHVSAEVRSNKLRNCQVVTYLFNVTKIENQLIELNSRFILLRIICGIFLCNILG